MSLKEQIIKASYDLFAEKGYEKTTVAEIINKAGTSKGGFYHHFKSKAEILEYITLSYVKDIQVYYERVLNNDKLTVIQKFTETFYGIAEMKKSYMDEWPNLSRIFYSFNGNHILLKKLADEFAKVTKQFYFNLINLGIDSGVFRVTYPDSLAALWSREIIQFHANAKKLFFSNNKSEYLQFENNLKFNEQLINHLLGLNENTIDLVTSGKNYIEMIKQEMKKRGEFQWLNGSMKLKKPIFY